VWLQRHQAAQGAAGVLEKMFNLKQEKINMNKKLFTGLASVVLALGLGVLSGCGGPASAPAIATMSEYDKIKEGMNYTEVSQIIGDPGSEEFNAANFKPSPDPLNPSASPPSPSGSAPVAYRWMNDDGSSISCIFQDNMLVSKNQSGLK
jgi:hypothetical protein